MTNEEIIQIAKNEGVEISHEEAKHFNALTRRIIENTIDGLPHPKIELALDDDGKLTLVAIYPLHGIED